MTPRAYDKDELPLPIEKLREFATALIQAGEGDDIHIYRSIGRDVRKALMDRGLHQTELEAEVSPLGVAEQLSAYFRDKDYLEPQEQRALAVALRNLGRTAFREPHTIGDEIIPLSFSLCPTARQDAMLKLLAERDFTVISSKEHPFNDWGNNMATQIAIPNCVDADGMINQKVIKAAVKEIRKLEAKAQTIRPSIC